MRRIIPVLLFIVAGVLAGTGVAFLKSPRYTSRASLRLHQQVLPQYLVKETLSIDFGQYARRLAFIALSRGQLSMQIMTLDLYPNERRRIPMEDVVALARRNLRFEIRGDSLEIEFTYADRFKAQRFVSSFTSSVIDGYIRERSAALRSVESFLQDSVEASAQEWQAADLRLKSSPSDDRLRLDRDLVRRQYEALNLKLQEQRLSTMLNDRGLGSTIEVLDTASLPTEPNTNRLPVILAGALGGLVAGIVFRLVTLALRVRQAGLAAVEVTP